ncbi:MAG: twin-arginine translocation signal domain-containing protein [Pseudomonadota bacterium]
MTSPARIEQFSDRVRLSRRGFLSGAGALAGAFSLGFSFPLPVKAEPPPN